MSSLYIAFIRDKITTTLEPHARHIHTEKQKKGKKEKVLQDLCLLMKENKERKEKKNENCFRKSRYHLYT